MRTGLALFVLCVATGGCSRDRVTIADTFPKGSYASPWVLQGDVWSGNCEQAVSGLGEDAERWAALEPEQVWLAVYRHDTYADHELIVRAWSFASPQRAREAFASFRPIDADELKAGDEGCWTQDGVLVRWGRMVFDIFGRGPSNLASPEQAVYLLAFIEKKMPADLPDEPDGARSASGGLPR